MSDSGIHIEAGSITQVLSNMQAFSLKLRAALLLDAQNISKNMERWAKDNAPWEDKTSNARQFLKAHVKWEHTDQLMVSLSHHVDYGVYLELANEGKYQILYPAIKEFTPQFLEGWKELINGGAV